MSELTSFDSILNKKLSSLAKVNVCGSLFCALGVMVVIFRKFFDFDISKYILPIMFLLWIFGMYFSIKHMFIEKHENNDK